MEIAYRWGLQEGDDELVPLPDTGAGGQSHEPDQDDATATVRGSAEQDAASRSGAIDEPRRQKTPPKSGREHDNEGGHDFDRAGSTRQVRYSIESSAPNAIYVLEVTNTDNDARTISEQLQVDCQRR